MIKLVPFAVEHFDQVEWQAPQADGRLYYQREWAEEIAASSDAVSAIAEDGYVIACAGVVPTRIYRVGNGPDVPVEALAWAIFSPRLSRHARSVFKAIRDFLNGRPEYKITAYVDTSHERAAPFIERLGFVYEASTAEAHPQGRVMDIYSRVRG